MRLKTDDDTLVRAVDESPAFEGKARRYEIVSRGLAKEHDAYLRNWKARMRAALQASPVYGQHAR